MKFTRRQILGAGALVASANALGAAQDEHASHDEHAAHIHPRPVRPAVPRLPALICKTTSTLVLDAAYDMLRGGADTLDAALHVTAAQEADVDDHSTGLGGLPIEDGSVQLDACCWHGPSRRAAAVGAVSDIRDASRLARTVMERTDMPLMVGAGARQFAATQGFVPENLSTPQSRQMWNAWKDIRSSLQAVVPGSADPQWPKTTAAAHFLPDSQRELDELVKRMEPLAIKAGLSPQWTWRTAYDALFPGAATLYVSTVDTRGELSSAATTSGVPWRSPGSLSDVAILGAGSYLDPDVGSAGAGGSAPANVKIAGSRTIVDNMRRGMPPEEAGLDALRQIARWYRNDMAALRFVEVEYYILRKDGAYGAVSLWRGDKMGQIRQFTIHDGERRTEDCRYLFDGSPPNGCKACA